MGEISLVCPGCRAEYRVPDHAIPEEGREVECSNCGRVWLAEPTKNKPLPLDLAALAIPPAADEAPPPPTAGPDPAQLSRRLPETVFNILRDEVEHEKRARAAQSAGPTEEAAAGAAQKPESKHDSEVDWPATTVTIPGQRGFRAPPFNPAPEPARSATSPAQLAAILDEIQNGPATTAETSKDKPSEDMVPRSPTPIRPAVTDKIQRHEPKPQPIPAAAAPEAQPARGSYRLGLWLGLLLIAAVLALYNAAPQLAGRGGAGEQLAQLRTHIDKGRLWLQQQIGGQDR